MAMGPFIVGSVDEINGEGGKEIPEPWRQGIS